MKPKSLIVGNWKLNKGPSETKAFVEGLTGRLTADIKKKIDIVIAPPFTSLAAAQADGISVAAQNVYWEDRGAFTGEVSAPILRELGVRYCIVGHSERRMIFNETDRMINLKAGALMKNGIRPIICVGERMDERKAGQMNSVVKFQLSAALFDIAVERPDDIVIAYEPVWAIGTGHVATPQQAEDMHEVIRRHLEKFLGIHTGNKIRILYGGSVGPDNIAGLVEKDEMNGALVGGASLDLEKFISIIQTVEEKER